jgi:hypothetical protein
VFWWVVAALAVLAVVVIVRDLARVPLRDEPPSEYPARELLYGHHAREAQGWTLQPPGSHYGSD